MKRKQKQIPFKFKNQGFTIVELLVALVVSLLALSAIYSTFLNQHKSYQVQEETAEMQQNIRAAMYYMQREIRMAGSNPFKVVGIGITAANANDISFTEDINGGAPGTSPDGFITATAAANESITYSLDGNGNLVRNAGAGDLVVAENIDALDFVYLNGSSVLNPSGTNVAAGNLNQIQSVEVTIVARTDDPLLYGTKNSRAYVNQRNWQILGPQDDNVSRRRLTALIHCRNLGL